MAFTAIKRAFPPLGSALRGTLREGYKAADARHDLLAGIAVGIIAVPLSLALAIASGVPPQHGLYTAFVAGAVIALAGGSRFNVSGPTAAFVVILFPIAQQHGVGGLLLATLMAGVILVAMGWGRMGQLIQYIPYPVTTGFTAGIALVIASLQLKGGAQRNVLAVLRDAGYLKEHGKRWYYQSTDAAVKRLRDTAPAAEMPPAF